MRDARVRDNVVAVDEAGGIHATGELEGFAAIGYSGHDHGEALEGAELVVLVGPAYGTEPQAAKAVAPHLTEGRRCWSARPPAPARSPSSAPPGSSSTTSASRWARRARCRTPCASTEPGVINVFHKLATGVYVAGLPRSGTDRLFDLVQDV